jgi:ribosomal protein S2
MNSMERFLETEAYQSLTKKEQLVYKRKLARVSKMYKGVKNLTKKPDLVIVVDAVMLDIFVNELEKQKNQVDAILICGTNFGKWRNEERIIVANIHSYKSLDYILKYLFN